jgi:hypothetical protein
MVLCRFTIYTRTRRDYERSLMRLTAEQQVALDAITPGHDSLVRGGAGTGKTIVLLHAWGKARRDLFTPRTVLLTYTTTLVKYDRYLAECTTTGFMSSAELATEVEDFLFANIVSKSEYLEERVAPHVMRAALLVRGRARWRYRYGLCR